MIDLEELLTDLDKLKDSMAEAESKLQNIQATSEAGAGLVKVTVNGHKKIVRIDIEKNLLLPTEKVMVQDLVVAAVNLALQKVEEKIKKEMKQTTPFLNILQDLMR